METAGRSGIESSSVLMRPESLNDSLTGADTRDRIFPVLGWALMGVLDTIPPSVLAGLVMDGRETTVTGVPTISLVAGGPKFGRRRRLRPNPKIERL